MAGKEFNLLFVYGTLKKGESNHYLFLKDLKHGEHAKFLCECRLKENYPLVLSDDPSLLNRPGMGKVVIGELYEIDDVVLSRIDILEGHPIYYLRTKTVVVNLKDESEIECEVYFNIVNVESLLLLPHISNYTEQNYK